MCPVPTFLAALQPPDRCLNHSGPLPNRVRLPCRDFVQAQRNDAAMVVRSLERDLNKKQSLFDDDTDFIREVRTGQAVSEAGEGEQQPTAR